MTASAFSITFNYRAMLDELELDGFEVSTRELRRLGDAAKDTARGIALTELKQGRDRADSAGEEPYVDSFFTRTERTANAVVLRVGNRHGAANIIEGGQKGHEIPPADGGHLAWSASRGDRATVLPAGVPVQHPGAKAYRIIGRSMRSVMQRQRGIARLG